METKKTVASMVEVQRSSPALLVLGVILLIALSAAGFYLFFQKSAIATQRDTLKTDIVAIQNQISDLKSKKIEAAQQAKEYLGESQKTEIIWSKVLSALQKNIPVDPITNEPKIHFLSYSGAAGGKLTLNAETRSAIITPFGDVSELIKVFNSSAFFTDAYVPSVSKGLADDGQSILSFIFNVTYNELAPESLNNLVQDSTVQGLPQTQATEQTQDESQTQVETQQTQAETQVKAKPTPRVQTQN